MSWRFKAFWVSARWLCCYLCCCCVGQVGVVANLDDGGVDSSATDEDQMESFERLVCVVSGEAMRSDVLVSFLPKILDRFCWSVNRLQS